MNIKIAYLSIMLLSFASVFTAGCSSDCESVCEDSKDCPNSTTKYADCSEICDEGEKQAEDAGCEDEYDDAASCAADLDDVCTDTGCQSESTALAACVAK